MAMFPARILSFPGARPRRLQEARVEAWARGLLRASSRAAGDEDPPSQGTKATFAALPTGDVFLIEVSGELDIATAPRLGQLLDEGTAHPAGALLVDLCDVTFMDSTGLNTLLAARRPLESSGKRLAIACRPDGAAADTFRLTALDRVFDLYEDRETALRALRG